MTYAILMVPRPLTCINSAVAAAWHTFAECTGDGR
jgi:hypothetical protein